MSPRTATGITTSSDAIIYDAGLKHRETFPLRANSRVSVSDDSAERGNTWTRVWPPQITSQFVRVSRRCRVSVQAPGFDPGVGDYGFRDSSGMESRARVDLGTFPTYVVPRTTSVRREGENGIVLNAKLHVC